MICVTSRKPLDAAAVTSWQQTEKLTPRLKRMAFQAISQFPQLARFSDSTLTSRSGVEILKMEDSRILERKRQIITIATQQLGEPLKSDLILVVGGVCTSDELIRKTDFATRLSP